ncbi:hypothetical protein [Streptomyces sp. R41]|uniref:Uncharacterized protein n=1 Tax=Streptomyces sp. R41 TaxID=3238632 RepID=A0AB39RVK3_9ACTN
MMPSPRGYCAATLHLAIDPGEHARRQQTGLKYISDSHCALLDTLMAFPTGVPVSVDALTDRQQDDVRRAPAGILDLALGNVTRHLLGRGSAGGGFSGAGAPSSTGAHSPLPEVVLMNFWFSYGFCSGVRGRG